MDDAVPAESKHISFKISPIQTSGVGYINTISIFILNTAIFFDISLKIG